MAEPTSDKTLAALAFAVGIPNDQIPTAVAIALAESSGDRTAYNGVGPDRSYGLWQINMKGSLGPDRRTKLGLNANEDLFSLVPNAQAMALISGKGKSWDAWSTFKNGAYTNYLARATLATNSYLSDRSAKETTDYQNRGAAGELDPGAAIGLGGLPINIPGNPLNGAADIVGSVASGAVSGVTSVAGFLGKLSDPKLWVRIGIGAIGAVLLVFVLFNLLGKSEAVSNATKLIP